MRGCSLRDHCGELLPHGVVVGEVQRVGVLDEGASMVKVWAGRGGRAGRVEVDGQNAYPCWETGGGPADAVGLGAEDESAAAGGGSLMQCVPMHGAAVVGEHEYCAGAIGAQLVERWKDQMSGWEQEVDLPSGLGTAGADGGVPVGVCEGVVMLGGRFRVGGVKSGNECVALGCEAVD